jgi:hypothetical protein
MSIDGLFTAKESAIKPPPMKPVGTQPSVVTVITQSNLSDDDLRELAREKLSALLQYLDPIRSPSLLLSVAREIMDRLEGRPTQRIIQDIRTTRNMPATDMTTEQLMLEVRKMQGVKLLENGMIDVTPE